MRKRNVVNFTITKKKEFFCQPTEKQYQNKQDKSSGTFLTLPTDCTYH